MTKKYGRIENKKLLQEYIDGLLLGDGSIPVDKRKGRLPWFSQTIKLSCVEWAQKIKKDINKFGLKCFIYGPYNRSEVTVRVETHPFFLKMRERWYSDKKKIVPKDLIITPIILGNWYLSDGKLDKDGMIILFTETFTFREVEMLSTLLNEFVGIESYVKKNEKGNPIIKIRAKEVPIFLSFIPKEFRLRCFLYKFNVKSDHRRMKWLPSEDTFLKEVYGKVPAHIIADKLRRSISSIYHRANRLGLKRR